MKGGKKMVTIILAVAILAYAGWAIYKIRMKKKNGGKMADAVMAVVAVV